MQVPNLADISTLLIDMDGTLLDLNFDNYFWNHYLYRRYAEIHDVPDDEARKHVGETLFREHGNLNWYCTDHWSREFQVDIIALKREVTDLIRYRDGACQFLRQLKTIPIEVLIEYCQNLFVNNVIAIIIEFMIGIIIDNIIEIIIEVIIDIMTELIIEIAKFNLFVIIVYKSHIGKLFSDSYR